MSVSGHPFRKISSVSSSFPPLFDRNLLPGNERYHHPDARLCPPTPLLRSEARSAAVASLPRDGSGGKNRLSARKMRRSDQSFGSEPYLLGLETGVKLSARPVTQNKPGSGFHNNYLRPQRIEVAGFAGRRTAASPPQSYELRTLQTANCTKDCEKFSTNPDFRFTINKYMTF